MRKLLLLGTATVLSAALSVGVMFAQDSASARPWLGVRVAETADGVVITQVQAGSPAADANLLVNDVIVTFNADEITSASDLAQDVQAAAAGATVAVDILRDGSPLTVDLTLGTSVAPAQTNRGTGGAFALDPLGLAERLLGVSLDEVETGYQVATVIDGFNPFSLQVGDVVTSLNGQDIKALDPNALRFDPRSAAPTLSLDVLRDGVTTTLQADLAFGRFGGDNDGGRFGGDDDGPGQFGGRHGGDFGGQFGGDDDNFGGDDDGGFAPQTQPDSTPAPLTLGNA